MRSIPLHHTQEFFSLIGIPYDVKNCWDIAVDFYLKILNINLSNIYSGDTPPREVTKELIYTNIGGFERVSVPEFGDIIILKMFGIESHIAIYVGEGKMLHTSQKTGSVIDFISRWERVIVGYYRVKKEK